ncbi:uncharacterized protein LOC125661344 isoform X2 [Ostrea edulis]|nr:uncharacterized protein LOC125661344 isoform X2 [Ostrea edulis]
MGYDTIRQKNPDLRKARYLRAEKRETERQHIEVASALLDLSCKENLNMPVSDPDLPIDCPSNASQHDNCQKKIAELRLENKQLYCELERLQVENKALKEQVGKSCFEEQVTGSDRKLQFHTGIPSVTLFMWLLSYVNSDLPTSKVMSAKSVLLCILMKLRLNLQHQDLAYRFNVSLTTISDMFNLSLPIIAKKLCFLIQWPEKQTLIQNMPFVFKSSYPKCCSIIDCFEVFIQRPGHLTTRAQTWSNYKHSNTIKFLVSITPTGAISYVSRAFGGRTSDKVITLRSGYLDKLQYGDQVMADRGFLIAEELANHGATLVIPAFTRGKTQLSARDVEQTRKIAHVRIHVERAIERIKNFNILSTNLSMHMVPHADSILTICAAVCNLQPKLVA